MRACIQVVSFRDHKSLFWLGTTCRLACAITSVHANLCLVPGLRNGTQRYWQHIGWLLYHACYKLHRKALTAYGPSMMSCSKLASPCLLQLTPKVYSKLSKPRMMVWGIKARWIQACVVSNKRSGVQTGCMLGLTWIITQLSVLFQGIGLFTS